MLEEKAENNLKKGLMALNMDVMNEIGLNQSGKTKEMDRTELNDFLQRIADMMFEIHLQNIYYFFTSICSESPTRTSWKKSNHRLLSPHSLTSIRQVSFTNQFAEAKKAKLNSSYLQVKQAEIQNKEFQTNPQLWKDSILNFRSIHWQRSTRKMFRWNYLTEPSPGRPRSFMTTSKNSSNGRWRKMQHSPIKKPSEQKAVLLKYTEEVKKKNTHFNRHGSPLKWQTKTPITNAKFDRKPY